MTWDEWSEFFDGEAAKLAAKYPEWIDLAGEASLADELARMDEATSAVVDEAAEWLADEGRFQELAIMPGAMLRLRMETAANMAAQLDFLERALSFSLPPKQRSKAEWIEWFLIHAWHGNSFAQIHDSLAGLRAEHNGDNPDPDFSKN